MLKKFICGTALIVTSQFVQAALIEYQGYSRDESSNIVIGGGLEWLMWDVTRGVSINDALAYYEGDGWSLASNTQMASLFNAFEFGKNDWDTGEFAQSVQTTWDETEVSAHNQFFDLFGGISTIPCWPGITINCHASNDFFRSSSAYYGSDLDGDGLFQLASVFDDFSRYLADGSLFYNDGFAYLSGDSIDRYATSGSYSVALVRSSSVAVDNPTPVNAPATILLFTLALAGLANTQRRKI